MLYYLDSKDKTSLSRLKQASLNDVGWKESDLESLMVSHIESLVRTDQLLVVAKQRAMQEEADIMALDKSGTLFIFELKRWRSQEDNILQVLRYGQKFGQFEYDRLNNYFQTYQRKSAKSPLDLKEAHKKYFDLDTALEPSKFNQRQRFIIVTNGLDLSTWNAIEYWKSYKLPVEALVYRIFKEEKSGEVFIDFDPFGPEFAAPDSLDEGLWVVNTNLTYDPASFEEMLRESKASAYGDRKHGIAKIKRGMHICLYHVGVGVIAIGLVQGDCQVAPYDGDDEGEYFVKCNFDYKVHPINEPAKAIAAWEINQKFGTGHKFRQTVFTLPKEYEAFIKEKFKEKFGKKV